ncbi:MAG TPA: hypothetical protein VI454_05530, partial [Verrucomicrobiae bacterium]
MKAPVFFPATLSGILLATMLTMSAPGADDKSSANINPATMDIVKLSDAGLSPAVVQSYVENSLTPFNPTSDDLIYLHQHGIADSITTAMIKRGAALRAQAPVATAAPRSMPQAYVAPSASTAYVYPAPSAYVYDYPAYYYYDAYPSYSYWYGGPYYYWPGVGFNFVFGGHRSFHHGYYG